MSNWKTATTELVGSSSYSAFDDQVGIPDLSSTAISQIDVTHDSYIRSLTVHYTNKTGVTRGLTDGTASIVRLAPGEWITEIQGVFTGKAIAQLSFVSSKGTRWGPYGWESLANRFHWEFEPQMGLLYFSGHADARIRGLKATFRAYRNHSTLSGIVKYEKQATTDLATESAVPLSKFTLNLMAPTVTLLIGPDNVEFHVSQILLCTLPFFRAALKGDFLEATDQRIAMPEDEPQHVSAMIEFISTGGYTYSYLPAPEADSAASPADLLEGSFHIGVYVTASKYDSDALAKASLIAFIAVLTRLESIDVIRLWRTAYESELRLAAVEDDSELVQFRAGLAGLLKELYSEHRAEMDRTSVDCPDLVNDLLRLVVSG